MLQMLLLAVVQGLTEFLPVSSSGHLVLLQQYFGGHEGDLFLDVVLHVGTLGSVLIVYRRELMRLLRLDAPSRGYVLALAVGTVPAVIVGLLLKDVVEAAFHSSTVAGIGLLVTGVLLLSTRRLRPLDDSPSAWEPHPVPLPKAFLIGCAQALAICPGISRSGSTITASLWLKLPRAEAARFSFMLSIPAIAGALILHLIKEDLVTRTGSTGLVMSALVAMAVGLIAIKLTALAVVKHHFWKFAFYVLPVGTLALILVGRQH
jgi:undecaprenyl-diphosphatase